MIQANEILEYLKKGNRISQAKCYFLWSDGKFDNLITDLAGRLRDLRDLGHIIKSKSVTQKNKKGKYHTWNEYYLVIQGELF